MASLICSKNWNVYVTQKLNLTKNFFVYLWVIDVNDKTFENIFKYSKMSLSTIDRQR